MGLATKRTIFAHVPVFHRALLVGLGLSSVGQAGCSCDSGMMISGDAGVDAFMLVRRDVGPDDLDGGDGSTTSQGDGAVDSGTSDARDTGRRRADGSVLDGEVLPSLICEYVRQDNTNYFLLGRDEDVANGEWIQSATSGTDVAVVFSDTDSTGSAASRGVYVFHYNETGNGGAPALIAGTSGGSRPSVAYGGGRFWVTYLKDGRVYAVRLSASFAADGSPVEVGMAAVTGAPSIAATSAGAIAAWATGNEVHTAFLTSSGALSGTSRRVVGETMPVSRASVQATGASGVTLVYSAGTSPRSIALVPSTGEARGTSTAVSDSTLATYEALDLAGRTFDTVEAPLAGAAVYDMQLTTTPAVFRNIAFRIITDDSSPNFLEQRLGERGISTWSPSVDVFRDGYLVAYQEARAELVNPRMSLAFLDRSGCALGNVTGRWPLLMTGRPEGASTPLSLTTAGDLVSVSWTERSDLHVEYFTTFAICYQP